MGSIGETYRHHTTVTTVEKDGTTRADLVIGTSEQIGNVIAQSIKWRLDNGFSGAVNVQPIAPWAVRDLDVR